MTKNILVLGAGKSSSSLIRFLIEMATQEQLRITVADADIKMAQKKIGSSKHAHAVWLDASNLNALTKLVEQQHLVISLLPPTMHVEVAKLCLLHKKHLLTASYLTPEMSALHQAAYRSGVIFLNECGLDPGIDHMSAMKIIDSIHAQKGKVTSFRSYCGGLIAEKFDTNPWNYKFTWNPRNVVLAGQQTARYIDGGKLQFIPPQRIFNQTETLKINGVLYDGYANRDSLSYIDTYRLQGIQTMLRGTLRKTGFCEAWDVLVKIGITDDTFRIPNQKKMTYASLLEALMPSNNKSLKKKLESFTSSKEVIKKIEWLGLLSDTPISGKEFSPADALQQLLEKHWKLEKGDLDLIVMQHLIDYRLKGKNHSVVSTLQLEGDSEVYTAMSKTVGLPLGVAAMNILNKKIVLKGVVIPTEPIIYNTLLPELKKYGVVFKEKKK